MNTNHRHSPQTFITMKPARWPLPSPRVISAFAGLMIRSWPATDFTARERDGSGRYRPHNKEGILIRLNLLMTLK